MEGCSSEGVHEDETCRGEIIRKCRQNEKETKGRKQEINMIGKNKKNEVNINVK